MRLYVPVEHIFLVNKKLEKFGWKFVADEEEMHSRLLPSFKSESSPLKYYYLQNFTGANGGVGVSVNMNLKGVPTLNDQVHFNSTEEMKEFFVETAKMEEVLKAILPLTIPYSEWKSIHLK